MIVALFACTRNELRKGIIIIIIIIIIITIISFPEDAQNLRISLAARNTPKFVFHYRARDTLRELFFCPSQNSSFIFTPLKIWKQEIR